MANPDENAVSIDLLEIVSSEDLLRSYHLVRDQTMRLCDPLEPEDFVLQAMPDASPTKWHLAHTTWFFEAFVLARLNPAYRYARDDANYLFNSYYNAVGERIARDRRGMLSRPSIAEILQYRTEVDRRIEAALSSLSKGHLAAISPILVLGLHHEQQHQELILTDLKVAFATNPIRPIYREQLARESRAAGPIDWIERPEGLRWLGHDGDGFAFDNESPRHRVFLEAFAIASRLATNGEYRTFMDAGGYERPEFWLSDGWAARNAAGWTAPMYWQRQGSDWATFTLAGMQPVHDAEPVTHLSFYEADAFSRWAGARLPTEAEWETVAREFPIEGNFLETGAIHPQIAPPGESGSPQQMYGDAWEWTASPYVAYPGYRPAAGALGEYNGKFMCNQMVLRGGSCATPGSHVRASYRNFFPPNVRWQFSGVRLAR